MNLTLSIGPLVSLIAGILILMVPRLLNFIVAIYLIVIGLLGLFGAGNLHLQFAIRLPDPIQPDPIQPDPIQPIHSPNRQHDARVGRHEAFQGETKCHWAQFF